MKSIWSWQKKAICIGWQLEGFRSQAFSGLKIWLVRDGLILKRATLIGSGCAQLGQELSSLVFVPASYINLKSEIDL